MSSIVKDSTAYDDQVVDVVERIEKAIGGMRGEKDPGAVIFACLIAASRRAHRQSVSKEDFDGAVLGAWELEKRQRPE